LRKTGYSERYILCIDVHFDVLNDDSFPNVVPNINEFNMAGLMTMPMVVIEVLVMSAMYLNKRRNTIVISVSAVALIGFYLLTSQQTGVTDRQFVKSMIPQYAGVILMVRQTNLSDPELKYHSVAGGCNPADESQTRRINRK